MGVHDSVGVFAPVLGRNVFRFSSHFCIHGCLK